MQKIRPELQGAGQRIAIVRSRFNESIGIALLDSCLARLAELGVAHGQITVATVPGALEVPLALQKLAGTRGYDALIALGAVIRGDTLHFEIVSYESAAGIAQVQLGAGIPVANGILTTDTDAQAEARAARKGRDCAEAAVEMVNLARAVFKLHQ